MYTYVPDSLTSKTTWVDPGSVTANDNPIILDSSGRAIIYGGGDYRFRVFDANSNLIYDEVTSAYALDSAISAAMAPIVSAATTATAISLMGIPAYVSGVVSSIALITGPTGPVGPTGPTGYTGPQGASSSGSLNRQGFTGSGTLSVPGSATFACVQIWGSGGGGGPSWASAGGGGGGGGYSMIMCLASDFTATVAITIGAGGAGAGDGSGAVTGSVGGTTTVGGYLYQAGGQGGFTSPIDGAPVTGASGYLQALSSGLTVIMAYQQLSIAPEASLSNGIAPYDRFGNMYGSLVGAGTPGQDSNLIGPFPGIWAGTGGTAENSGSAPGGGGGVGNGNGASGQVVVTFF